MSNPLFDSEEMKFGEPVRCGEFVAGGDPLAYLLSIMASRLSLSVLEVDENHHDTVLFNGARPFIASDYQLNSPLAAILRDNPRAVISYVEEDQFRVGYVGKLFTVEEILRVIVDSVDLNLEVSPDFSVDFNPADFSFNAFNYNSINSTHFEDFLNKENGSKVLDLEKKELEMLIVRIKTWGPKPVE